jgi:hypothetical protein
MRKRNTFIGSSIERTEVALFFIGYLKEKAPGVTGAKLFRGWSRTTEAKLTTAVQQLLCLLTATASFQSAGWRRNVGAGQCE